MGLGRISDALVGRVRWSNPAMLADVELLFGKDDNFRQNYIDVWRKRVTQAIICAMEAVEVAERRAFGDRSFFYCREHDIEAPPADDPPLPEEIGDDIRLHHSLPHPMKNARPRATATPLLLVPAVVVSIMIGRLGHSPRGTAESLTNEIALFERSENLKPRFPTHTRNATK